MDLINKYDEGIAEHQSDLIIQANSKPLNNFPEEEKTINNLFSQKT